MTVDAGPGGPIKLANECTLEDAELLLQALLAAPDRPVDWTGCTMAHTAVVQVLLALRPAMVGLPAGRFLQDWVAPHLGARDVAPA